MLVSQYGNTNTNKLVAERAMLHKLGSVLVVKVPEDLEELAVHVLAVVVHKMATTGHCLHAKELGLTLVQEREKRTKKGE